MNNIQISSVAHSSTFSRYVQLLVTLSHTTCNSSSHQPGFPSRQQETGKGTVISASLSGVTTAESLSCPSLPPSVLPSSLPPSIYFRREGKRRGSFRTGARSLPPSSPLARARACCVRVLRRPLGLCSTGWSAFCKKRTTPSNMLLSCSWGL